MNQINIRFKVYKPHSSLLKKFSQKNQSNDDEITMLDLSSYKIGQVLQKVGFEASPIK
jgi:hypothetical protein